MQKILVILLVGLISSCSVFNKRPKNILNEDDFVKILTDIHMADGILATQGLNVHKDSSTIELLYQDVINKYHTSQHQFEQTVKYYSTNPNDFEKVYEKVSEELAKIESEIQQNANNLIEDNSKSEVDSIKQIQKEKRIKNRDRED